MLRKSIRIFYFPFLSFFLTLSLTMLVDTLVFKFRLVSILKVQSNLHIW